MENGVIWLKLFLKKILIKYIIGILNLIVGILNLIVGME